MIGTRVCTWVRKGCIIILCVPCGLMGRSIPTAYRGISMWKPINGIRFCRFYFRVKRNAFVVVELASYSSDNTLRLRTVRSKRSMTV